MRREILVGALVLPLLAIGLGIVRAELFLADTNEFTFEVAGFDPRDLLRGHYLQFRVRVDEPLAVREPCDDANGHCCLCLTRVAPGAPPLAERATCDTARASCDGALHTRYLDEPQRYYVPEERAHALEERLREAVERRAAQVVLAIDSQGEARVREMLVDGEPLR